MSPVLHISPMGDCYLFSSILDGNPRHVCHDYSMFYPVQHLHIAGDCHIAASDFLLPGRKYVG